MGDTKHLKSGLTGKSNPRKDGKRDEKSKNQTTGFSFQSSAICHIETSGVCECVYIYIHMRKFHFESLK